MDDYGTVIRRCYNVESWNFTAAGEAASDIKKVLKQLGINASLLRRVAIAAYEAEMNLVIHSVGGRLEMSVDTKKIVMVAEDQGPGIENIDKAMQEGYSTAPDTARELGFGAGMGLSNIKRCTDRFEISSKVGEGTHLEMHFNLEKR